MHNNEEERFGDDLTSAPGERDSQMEKIIMIATSRYNKRRKSHIGEKLLRTSLNAMRLNYETAIIGSKTILVPYRKLSTLRLPCNQSTITLAVPRPALTSRHLCSSANAGPEHVEHYHDWMKDPGLLAATGSEPLSLEEEMAMQQSWRDDKHKVTFIVLARADCDKIPESDTVDDGFVKRNIDAMAGDVNLFLSEEENDEEPEAQSGEVPPSGSTPQAEIDIMIAESKYRGKGLGKEASCLMMLFGATHLKIRRFFCKINDDNMASMELFRKLDFKEFDFIECFRQHELELKKESNVEMIECLQEHVGMLKSFSCPIKEHR